MDPYGFIFYCSARVCVLGGLWDCFRIRPCSHFLALLSAEVPMQILVFLSVPYAVSFLVYKDLDTCISVWVYVYFLFVFIHSGIFKAWALQCILGAAVYFLGSCAFILASMYFAVCLCFPAGYGCAHVYVAGFPSCTQ